MKRLLIVIFILSCSPSKLVIGNYTSEFGYTISDERYHEYVKAFYDINRGKEINESILSIANGDEFYYLIGEIQHSLKHNEGLKKNILLLKNNEITAADFLKQKLELLILLEQEVKHRPTSLQDAKYILRNGGNSFDAFIILGEDGSSEDIKYIEKEISDVKDEKYLAQAYVAIEKIKVRFGFLPKEIKKSPKKIESIREARQIFINGSGNFFDALDIILTKGSEKEISVLKEFLSKNQNHQWSENIKSTITELEKKK